MDVTTLAANVVALLSPLMMKVGEKSIEKVGAKLPAAAGKVWEEIRKKIGRKETAKEAMKDFAAKPDDHDNEAAFRKELRKVFELDSKFAKDLEKMLDAAQESIANTGSGAVATYGGVAAGAGGVAVGGNVHGNIVLGNNNTVIDKQDVHHQSGGVNFTNSDVKVDGDIVGRDKK